MAGRQYGNSVDKNNKWIKEGRGSGLGKDYLPWLTVRDLASQGRSHRVFGHKCQRTQQLLSDLELAIFLILEWISDSSDIREQFPLQLEVTERLAKENGIKHPAYQGVIQVMSSDFLVTTTNKKLPKFAIQAKIAETLQDPRTIEKLEIERRYWKLKLIPWFIVTEKDILGVVFQNINWLYPAQRDELSLKILFERVEFYYHHIQDNPEQTIIEIAKKLDRSYEMEPGESLLELRQLLAKRFFIFDIFIPYRKLKSSNIKLSDM